MKQKLTLFFFTFYFLLFTSESLFAQDGILDVTFGNNGVSQTTLIKQQNENYVYSYFIEELPDGGLLMLNSTAASNIEYGRHLYLNKFLENGKADSSFGENGVIEILPSDGFTYAIGLVAQPDGNILVETGDVLNYNQFKISRLLPNGEIDFSFAKKGVLVFTGPDYSFLPLLNSMSVQPDGKIITGGVSSRISFSRYTMIMRFNNDGSVDSSFNGTGKFIYEPSVLAGGIFGNVSSDAQHQVELQPDGKILFSSYAAGGILRLNTDGTRDMSFGNSGIIAEQKSGTWGELLYDIRVMEDGSFMCAGVADRVNTNNDYYDSCFLRIYRYDNQGKRDISLAGTGQLDVFADIGQIATISSLNVQSNKKFLFTWRISFDDNYTQIKRYNLDGSADTDFGISGLLQIPVSDKGDPFFNNMIILDNEQFLANYTIDLPGDTGYSLIARYNNTSVLPITLTSFATTKKENTSLLQWHTCSETNCKGFSIERSTDNKTFTPIGFAASKGGGNKCSNDYSFIDKAPANGINYYRLKIQDNDGKFSYSNVENLQFKIQNLKFKITPNPVVDILKVEGLDESMKYELRIINDQGREMYSSFSTHYSTFSIHVSSLPAGVYYLIAVNENGERQTLKFVKQ